jgi:heat shock protein HtpX
MRRSEVEAVLAHEVAHVANGDMVTLTLVQGVVNTFVFFLARVVAYGIQKTIARDNEAVGGLAYTLTVVVLDLLFGVLAMVIVAYFSRIREYRADAGAASLNGSPEPMIRALERLQKMDSEPLPKQMAASGISGGKTLLSLFSTHPSIEERIAALRS